jgi:hypothetical protein
LPKYEICGRIEKKQRRRIMQTQFDEHSTDHTEEQSGNEYAYKTVIKKDMKNRRTVSVISLIIAVLSLLLFLFSWVSLILGLASVGGAAFSRKNLGYFDKLSIAAIIVGIFGVVFAISGIIFKDILTVFFGW